MPDLDSPQTYGEWQGSIDKLVSDSINEQGEKDLSPVLNTLIHSLSSYDDLPAFVKTFLASMQSPIAPSWFETMQRFAAQVGGGVLNRAFNHEFKDFDYALNKKLQNLRLTPEIANTLKLRQKISDELWTERNKMGGYEPVEASFVYESQKPYPPLQDIIAYARYNGEPESPKEITWSKYDVSPDDWGLWEFLSRIKLSTEQVQKLYQRRAFSEQRAYLELSRLGWIGDDKSYVMDLAFDIPNAMILIQGGLFQGVDNSSVLDAIAKAGIKPFYAQTYLDAVLTKPDTQDIINYQLRHDTNLSNLDSELSKIGIHPNYFNLYKELAYPIPPIQDIITMAVREAFTPDIAARFGQYQDLPEAYIQQVARKGISREWAERYWAAHWNLPSPQQGFEMLHRGVINMDDLNLLLRALDIMPFWRDKLIQISYNPLTRVDVRRMYGLGVINESEVNKAYRDIGYNDQNAARLTEFTIRQVKQSASKLTASDIIKAYTDRFISINEAKTLLIESGLKENTIPAILEAAEHKKQWAIKEERITAIENLYKKGRYTQQQTEQALYALNLPSDYVTTLIQQWVLKSASEQTNTLTTAQTLSFLKAGLITSDRAITELALLGYDAERINIFINSVKAKTVV